MFGIIVLKMQSLKKVVSSVFDQDQKQILVVSNDHAGELVVKDTSLSLILSRMRIVTK